MGKYILRKDVPGIGKAGDTAVWSEQSQMEYAKMIGKEKEWPFIRDEFLMPMPEGIYYTEKTVKVIHCNHPKVERIWEFGGLSQSPTNGAAIRSVCIMIKEGKNNPIQFDDYGDGSAITQAEQYLQSLK